MTLEACLPPRLRGGAIARVRHGLSGAGVYRVEANGRRYVLKVSASSDPIDTWRERLSIQQRAAEAGVAPQIVHHDEAHRAVVSEFVGDRGFLARMGDPRTRAATIELVAQVLRRAHAIPLAPETQWQDPREKFTATWRSLNDFTLPSFARALIDGVFAETPPSRERAMVLSHNDPNPSNIVFDGQRVLLLDWDSAGPNDPSFDLAAVALFLRFDDATAEALVAAYDERPLAPLSPYFLYARRLLAAGCAAFAFNLARRGGHPGRDVRREDAPTLLSVHSSMGAGTLSLSTPAGLWAFALGLVHAIDA